MPLVAEKESDSTLVTIAVVPAPRTPAIPAPIRRLLFMSSTLPSRHLGERKRKVKKRQRFPFAVFDGGRRYLLSVPMT
jgi:hypothetical protein